MPEQKDSPTMTGVSIETVHFAHICINVQSHVAVNEADFPQIIDEKMQDILADYDPDCVDIDPELCCNALTEVGLRGNNVNAVVSAANALAEWVSTHPKLDLVS